MNDARNCVEAFAKLQPDGFHAWMLANGKAFEGARGFNPGFKPARKACFYNGQMAALDDDKLDYYEGYAVTKKLPGLALEHGWNVKRGRVLDCTWSDGTQYFGVKIPTDFIRELILTNKTSQNALFEFYRLNRSSPSNSKYSSRAPNQQA